MFNLSCVNSFACLVSFCACAPLSCSSLLAFSVRVPLSCPLLMLCLLLLLEKPEGRLAARDPVWALTVCVRVCLCVCACLRVRVCVCVTAVALREWAVLILSRSVLRHRSSYPRPSSLGPLLARCLNSRGRGVCLGAERSVCVREWRGLALGSTACTAIATLPPPTHLNTTSTTTTHDSCPSLCLPVFITTPLLMRSSLTSLEACARVSFAQHSEYTRHWP